jgi:CHAT domain-containing protein/tetratricopeptide (TPR) repeat protein
MGRLDRLLVLVPTCAFVVFGLATKQAGSSKPVQVGDTVHGEHVQASTRAGQPQPTECYVFEPLHDGPVTISLESFDFDVAIEIKSNGPPPVTDDIKWLEHNSWSILHAQAGAQYRIGIRSADGRPGEFALRLTEGASRPPSGEAAFRERFAFCEEAARRAQVRGDSARAAHYLKAKGELCFTNDKLAEARTAFDALVRVALDVNSESLELEARAYIAALDELAGKPWSALVQLDTVQPEIARTGPPELVRFVLEYRSMACLDADRCDDAANGYGTLLAAARSLNLPREESLAWSGLGAAILRLGEVASSEVCHHNALACISSCEHPDIAAGAWMAYGVHSQRVGDPAKAIECQERALVLAVSPRLRMNILGHMGNLLFESGHYRDAYARYRESAQLAHELTLEDYEGRLLLAFANLDDIFRDPDTAKQKLVRAIGLLSDEEHCSDRAEALISLGQVLLEKDEQAESCAAFSEALAIGRRKGNRPLQAKALLAMSDCDLSAEATYPKARREILQAQDLANGVKDPDLMADAVAYLAWIDYLEHDHRAAEAHALEALNLYRNIGADEKRLHALDTLENAALALEDAETAAEALNEAQSVFDGEFLLGLGLDDASKLRANFTNWDELGQDYAAMARKHSINGAEADAQGFQLADQWKARSLLGGIAGRRRLEDSRELAWLQRQWEEARNRWLHCMRTASVTDNGRNRVAGQAAIAEAESIRNRIDQIASDAARECNAHASAAEVRGCAAAAIRTMLAGSKAAVIEYACGKTRLYAYAFVGDNLNVFDLGDKSQIEMSVASFCQELYGPRLASTKTVVAHGHSLYRTLLEPVLLSQDGVIETIIIVPTTGLAVLPFEALVVEPPRNSKASARFADSTFVLQRWDVTYAPSSAVLVELGQPRGVARSPMAMLIGDPKYGASETEPSAAGSETSAAVEAATHPGSTRAERDARQLPRLKHTRLEVCDIASLLNRLSGGGDADDIDGVRQEQHDAVHAQTFDLWVGAEATRERLLENQRLYSIIHIATHGFADAQDPDANALALAFAGGSDGYLTYRDVMNLSLDADLTVLSSCESGRGPALPGEGVLSLARAFMFAGSRSVIASLWAVNDPETNDIMRELYTNMVKIHIPAFRALRLAKLEMFRSPNDRGGTVRPDLQVDVRKSERADPVFWAAFIYMGLPR